MERRNFLKTAVVGTAAAGVTRALNSCSDSNKTNQEIRYFHQIPSLSSLLILENEFLRVEILNDASTKISDKKNGIDWSSGPVALQEKGTIEEGHVWMRNDRSMCEEYPGRFVGEKSGDTLEFTLLARQNQIIGKFKCQVSLENEWLVYKIISVEDQISSLVFPTPIKNDALVLPMGIGKIIRKQEHGGIYARKAFTFFTHLNMRWTGGLNDKGGWIGIYDDGFEDSGALVANRTVAPFWTRTLGEWKHPFVYRMKFVKGNYVQLAKEYRQWFISKGLFKSLKDKIAENAKLKDFIGGRAFWFNLASPNVRKTEEQDILFGDERLNKEVPEGEAIVHCTFKEAQTQLDKLEKLGMKKGFMKIAGWINRGYDASHPDVWPPDPKIGTPEELAELLKQREGWVMGLHDNYMDIYNCNKSFPKGVIRNADGTLLTGGFWAGGQAYIMNYRDSLGYAKRNWENIKILGTQAMFCDTTTAMQLYQSYEKGNEYTKADDCHYKLELIKFFRKEGILFGSEEVADFAIPAIDWYENRHNRVEGESIPLWPLVFHDAAFCMRYHPGQKSYPAWLEDMLYGYMMHFFMGKKDLDEKYFKETFQVDEWHSQIATDEMISHAFLTDDYSVEETVFSSGRRIICNFGTKPFHDKEGQVRAGNYKIFKV